MASENAYEALRRDLRNLHSDLAAVCANRPRYAPTPDPRDEQIDAQRLEIARLRVIVTRVIEIPREPERLSDDDNGRAYLRGWQDVRALVDKALLPEEEG